MGKSDFNPAVVAPTYNNARTLVGILKRIELAGIPLIVVNDGSTDATAALLEGFASDGRPVRVVVLQHERNCGKGMAMQTGFREAARLGYTHALTIDTDGQLDPEQIPELLAMAKENPQVLVVGVRDEGRADYPSRSRVGRRVSNCLVFVESGLRVADSQCGFRVYPLGLVMKMKCGARRFGYETEIISRAGWAGCGVVETPVNCVYLPPGQQVSHFRPVVDSLRAAWMHVRLVARALAPWPHVKWPGPREPMIPTWRSMVHWMSPREAWRQLRDDQAGRTMFAVGLALGVFIANLPAYGVQTILALYASRRLHLHPMPAVLASQISTPPFGVALIVAAVYVGHLMLHGTLPSLPEGPITTSSVAAVAPRMLVSWLVGSPVVGLAAALITFVAALGLFRVVLPRKRAGEVHEEISEPQVREPVAAVKG